MKDEIKSFLVQIKGNDEWKEIYNYITNLQEELEEEKRIEQASLDTINNLQEENESLKQQLDFIEEQNKYIDKLEKLSQEKDKEIERLNNIIEEIEECIKQNCEIIRFTDAEGNLVDKIGNIDGARLLNYIDKLKELKEGK